MHHLVLACEAITDPDVTGAEALGAVQGWLGEHDVTFSISRVRPNVRRGLDRFDLLGNATICDTNRAAVASVTRSD